MSKANMRAHGSSSYERRRTACRASALAIIVFSFATFTDVSAVAQNFTLLYTFTGVGDGAYPGDVVLDSRGIVYGSTYKGGSFGYGVVFKLDAGGKETVLHNFVGADGLGAGGSLLQDEAGNLYGEAWEGGTPEGGGCRFGCGILFKLDKSDDETVLYAFNSNVQYPRDVIRDESGNFYGVTAVYGPIFWGTVFKVNNAGTLTVLHQFTGKADGGLPYGRLILDAQGNLYGTTYNGGNACSCGVVFKIDPAGKETVLYAFAGGTDGGMPVGGLVRDDEGNLYGTTSQGGDMTCNRGLGCGTVFRLDQTGKKTLLYTFKGPDGSTPSATLVRDSAGDVYGTTDVGGTSTDCRGSGCGTVFKLEDSGKETVLHSFTGADGNEPGDLFLDAAGTLYGATNGGGNTSRCGGNYGGCGVVFKLTP